MTKETPAAIWLRGYLTDAGGSAYGQDVVAAGKTAGHSQGALYRARATMGLDVSYDSSTHGRGRCLWGLPADDDSAAVSTDPLVGLYALTFEPCAVCGRRRVRNQLRIKGRVNDSFYLVDYYSWLHGYYSTSGLRAVSEMTGWDFFYDADDFRHEGDAASCRHDHCDKLAEAENEGTRRLVVTRASEIPLKVPEGQS